MRLLSFQAIVLGALVAGCPVSEATDRPIECRPGWVYGHVEPTGDDWCNLICHTNADCASTDGLPGTQFCGTTDYLVDTKVCQAATACGEPTDPACPRGSTCKELGCAACASGNFCLPEE